VQVWIMAKNDEEARLKAAGKFNEALSDDDLRA
jgi:hypothetical protein